jgi:hypothetical protein
MYKGFSAFGFLLVISSVAFGQAQDMGFVNVVNGATKPIKLSINGQVAFEAIAAGTMTGGLSLGVGRVKMTAEAEGMRDDSSPVDIVKDTSKLVVVAEFEDKEDPSKKVLRVEPIPYKVESTEGFSAGLVYAGKEPQVVLDVGGKPVALKRYSYVDVGTVSKKFEFKNARGQAYQSDFYEPIHYTLVILDSDDPKNLKVLVVPNIAFKQPTF